MVGYYIVFSVALLATLSFSGCDWKKRFVHVDRDHMGITMP